MQLDINRAETLKEEAINDWIKYRGLNRALNIRKTLAKATKTKKDPYALKIQVSEDKAALKIQKAYRNHIGRMKTKEEQEGIIREYGCRIADVTERINGFMEEKESIMDRIKQIKENLNDIEREKYHQEKLMEVYFYILYFILENY